MGFRAFGVQGFDVFGNFVPQGDLGLLWAVLSGFRHGAQ